MRHVKEDWAEAADVRISSSVQDSCETIAPLANHKPATSVKSCGLKLDAIVQVSSQSKTRVTLH